MPYHILGYTTGIGSAPQPVSFGYLTYGSASNAATTVGGGRDSAGNVYLGGYLWDSDPVATVSKYDSSGVLQWQRKYGEVSGWEQAMDATVDSAGNTYVVGMTQNAQVGDNDGFIIKYNSSGVLQWQRLIGLANDTVQLKSVQVDSQGNVYVSSIFSDDAFIKKFDSNGNGLWAKRTQAGGAQQSESSIHIASNHILVGGYTSPNSLISRFGTDGTWEWTRTLNIPGAGSSSTWGITEDSAGNIYASGRLIFSSGFKYAIWVAKLSSTGTFQWGRIFGSTGFSSYAVVGGIRLNSTEDTLLVVGHTQVGAVGGHDWVLLKYDPATGGPISQFHLGGVGSDSNPNVEIDSGDNLYLTGNHLPSGSTNSQQTLVKLPFNYGASTVGDLTIASGSINDTSATFGISNQSNIWTIDTHTDVAGTLTEQAAGYSSDNTNW